jgi:hypothetical protein
MRLALPLDNPAKECISCKVTTENYVSGYILSFQVADQLLRCFPGSWEIWPNQLTLQIEGVEEALVFNLGTGSVNKGELVIQLLPRYSSDKKLITLTEEIARDLGLPPMTKGNVDSKFQLLVKLVEIFHARCGLHILPVLFNQEELLELRLCQEGGGPQGWLSKEGMVLNRFGESVDMKKWSDLRPEMQAANLFGFQRFCRHYPNPESSSLAPENSQ